MVPIDGTSHPSFSHLTPMTDSTSATPRRKRSCLGRFVTIAVLFIIVAVLVVAFLPKLLSTGPGRRFVERMAAPSVNGTLTMDALSLSWTGAQRIDGLRIVDRNGRQAIDLDIDVENGLLSLAGGGWKTVRATVDGAIEVELRADGSNSLSDLVPPSPAKPAPPSGSKPATPTPSRDDPVLPAGLDATLLLDSLDLTIIEQSTGRTAKLEDLAGEILASTIRPSSVKLDGTSTFEGRSGTLKVDAIATDLVQPDGRLRFAGAAVDADLALTGVTLPLPEMLVEIRSLTAALDSTDLTELVKLVARGEATLNGSTPSELVADVQARKLFGADGSVAFSTDALVADVTAKSLPLAAIEPLLGELPIVPSRDLGPTADATLRYPGGGGGGAITLALATENLTVDGTGTVDAATQSIDMSRLVLDARVQPALLEEKAGVVAPAAVPVRVELSRLTVPGGKVPETSLAGTLSIPGRVEFSKRDAAAPGGLAPLGVIENLAFSIDSTRLAEEIHLTGGGMVEGGTLAIDERLVNAFGADGAFNLDGAAIIGSIALTDMPTQRALGVLDADTAKLARELLSGPMNARITTAGSTTREATVTLTSGTLAVDGNGTLHDRTLSVAALRANVPLTPALLDVLHEGAVDPIRLDSATALTATVRPFTLSLDALDRVMTEGPPITADLALAPATLSRVPGIETTASIRDFSGVAVLTPGQRLGARFDGGMKLLAGGAALGAVAAKIDAVIPQGADDGGGDAANQLAEKTELTATIDATGLEVATVEKALGKEPGSLVGLLGARGDVHLTARPKGDGITEVSLKPAFESLTGDLTATHGANVITVDKGTLQVALTPAQVDTLLKPSTSSDKLPLATIAGPLRFDATLEGVSIDQRLFGDDASEPSDPAKTRGTLTATLNAPTMKLASGQSVEFQPIQLRLESPRIDQGVTLRVDGKGTADGKAATIAVQGALRNLVDARSRLDTTNATLDLDASIVDVPTIVVDRLQDLDGLLVTALGDLLSGSLKTQALSSRSGTIAASLTSANGRVDVPQATIRDDAVVIDRAKPITGEFQITPPLRERLLRQINPLLADIRQTKQPIRLSVPDFVLPLDDNRARLNGDIQMTFGDVEFDAGSPILGFLDAFNKRISPTIPGFIEPLNVVIRAGQLTYRDFAVRVNPETGGTWKHSLVFSGDVDLAANPPFVRAIKSMYPTDGLARSIKELQQIPLVGTLSVGITFFGPLYDAAGEPKKLEHKVDVELPKPEDILKDPKIQDALGDLLKKLDKK